MKPCVRVLIFGIAFLIIFPSFVHAAGDLQITAEPGVRIWLDDQFKGKTTADDMGMFIEKLQSGTHEVKAAKEGFKPIIQKITIKDGQTLEIKLKFTIPSMEVRDLSPEQNGTLIREVGNLILRCAPLHAEVFLDGKSLGIGDKSISDLPAGRHDVKFVYGGKTLSGSFNLNPGETLKLKGHFREGRIINEAEQERQEFERLFEVVSVKGGCFEMGDTFGAGDNDEKPVHEVCVDGFWIGKYEVTQGQWKNLMGSNPSNFTGNDNLPVERVTWFEARDFIQRLNEKTGRKFRLPTEAEWEYAARSGGKREKWSGTSNEQEVGEYVWYSGNSWERTRPVGQKRPNGLGLYDMSGNVCEWCHDWYDETYYRRSPRKNPREPDSGEYPVLRGGSWSISPKLARVASRYWIAPSARLNFIGFRLVLPIE